MLPLCVAVRPDGAAGADAGGVVLPATVKGMVLDVGEQPDVVQAIR